MQLSKTQQKYIDAIIEHSEAVGVDTNKTNFSRAELRLISMALKGKKWIPNWITHDQSRRVDRGVFSIPEVMDTINPVMTEEFEQDPYPQGVTSDGDADNPNYDVPDDPPHTYVEDNPQTDVNQQAMEELAL